MAGAYVWNPLSCSFPWKFFHNPQSCASEVPETAQGGQGAVRPKLAIWMQVDRYLTDLDTQVISAGRLDFTKALLVCNGGRFGHRPTTTLTTALLCSPVCANQIGQHHISTIKHCKKEHFSKNIIKMLIY